MDDLKIITNNINEMKEANRVLLSITEAIGMTINDSKSGLLVNGEQQIPEELSSYPLVTRESPYKYLGVDMDNAVNKEKYIQKLKASVEKSIDEVCKETISSINTIRKVNSDIISKIRYGCSVVRWNMKELEYIDCSIRKKLSENNIWFRNLPSARLYLSMNKLGMGLMNCRAEYGKELIRVFLKYKWHSDTKIFDLIEATNNTKEGIWKRIILALRKYMKECEVVEIIENENNTDKNIQKVLKEIETRIDNYYYEEWKKSKVGFARNLESSDLNSMNLIKVWKKLNIKRSAFIQILKIQENAICTGNKKAHILKNEQAKYCKYCQFQVCSISHILLNCGISKKLQIARHDYVCKETWAAIMKKYTSSQEYEIPPIVPKCTVLEDKNITILFNKDITLEGYECYAKRPDIYIENGEKEAYIIDIAISKEENIMQNYYSKINKYRRLQEIIRKERKIKKILIVPIILSINGFICQPSLNILNIIQIKINWERTIRKLVIDEMKDLMFYLHQQLDGIDLEQGNSRNTISNQTL